jgi:hypothetical protein
MLSERWGMLATRKLEQSLDIGTTNSEEGMRRRSYTEQSERRRGGVTHAARKSLK